MTIQNLPYSFMQFEPISHSDYILPVFQESDIWFAILVRGATFEEAQDIYNAPANEMQLLLLRGYDNVPASVTPQTLRNYAIADGLTFLKYKVSDNDILFVWKNDLKKVITNTPLIECNECFQLGLLFRGTKLVSNPLKKICDDKDTSAVSYSSEDNSFQFYYCGTTLENRVRVPLIMQRPQITSDETIYVRSDGSRQLIKSVKAKQYECQIDFSYITFHEKLEMALSHDNVEITSRAYSGKVVRTGNYEIDWDNPLNPDFAQAQCSLIVTPFNAKNSNCGTCEDCIGVEMNAVPLPGAVVGYHYHFEIPFTGTLPARLSNVIKPDDISISVVGSSIVFDGIFSEVESNPLSFTILNCFGLESAAYSGSINVTNDPVNPSSVLMGTVGYNGANFFWTEVSGATGYRVNVWDSATPGNSVTGYPKVVSGLSDSIVGLTPETSYDLSVTALFSWGEGDPTDTGLNPDFTTIAAPECREYTFTNTGSQSRISQYIDCSGQSIGIGIEPGASATICGLSATPGPDTTVTDNGPC